MDFDFTFAYDVKDYSDRLLRIEIRDGEPKHKFISTNKPRIKEDAEKGKAVDVHTNMEKEKNVKWKMPKLSTNVFFGYDDEEQQEIFQTSDEDNIKSDPKEDIDDESDSYEDFGESDSYEDLRESDSFNEDLRESDSFNEDIGESNTNEGIGESDTNEGIGESDTNEGIGESSNTNKDIGESSNTNKGIGESSNTNEGIGKWNTNEYIGESDSKEDIGESDSKEDIGESDSNENIFELNSKKDIFESNSKKVIDKSNSEDSAILRVKSIHINSQVLVAKSGFFNKLFLNEPKNSERRNVTIRICESEEVALMHLLRFIYSNTLSTSISHFGLIEVIRVADKYKVLSCMEYCSKLLLCFEMRPMAAVANLRLSSVVRMVQGVQPVIDAAEQYLTRYFNNFERLQHELMMLPLLGIEVVLSSNDLQISSEDNVYEFLIKWIAFHYSKPVKLRKVMKRLSKLMRFHYMSCKTLKNVMSCPYFDSSVSSKLVLDALFFQAESSHNQLALIEAGDFSVKRAYRQFPKMELKFQFTTPQCTVYVDLKREECIRLSNISTGLFQVFNLNGEKFYLNMRCNLDEQTGYDCFGLVLGMQNKCVGSTRTEVCLKFSAMQKPSEEFISMYEANFIFDGGTTVGNGDLFGMPWKDLMAEDCVYFMDGSLLLMVELMIM